MDDRERGRLMGVNRRHFLATGARRLVNDPDGELRAFWQTRD